MQSESFVNYFYEQMRKSSLILRGEDYEIHNLFDDEALVSLLWTYERSIKYYGLPREKNAIIESGSLLHDAINDVVITTNAWVDDFHSSLDISREKIERDMSIARLMILISEYDVIRDRLQFCQIGF